MYLKKIYKSIKLLNHLNDKKDIYLFYMNDFHNIYDSLIDYITEDERKNMLNINSKNGRMKYLFRKSLRRIILSEYLNVNPLEIKFALNKYGKPYILNNPEGINFNISHSKEYLLIGISKSSIIGVDIETKESFDKKNKNNFKNIYSNGELKKYKLLDNDEKENMFRISWIQKESISKAMGYGLLTPFSSIDLSKNKIINNNLIKYWIMGNKLKVILIKKSNYYISIASINNDDI